MREGIARDAAPSVFVSVALGLVHRLAVIRRAIDRAFGLLALGLARGFHRRFMVDGLDAARADTPRVVVANHFNGFMDVVVLVAALGRLPRFVGKATLRNVVVARPFLRLAGVVLVQRRADGEGTGANEDAFVQCHERLAAGDCIVIFPEGTTHDQEVLAPIRTGAARIALGAVAKGVDDVVVVPVGLTFGDKTRLRNDVLVAGGPPITVGHAGEDDPAAVQALTDELTEGLAALIPGVEDPLEAWSLQRAALIAERRPGVEPSLATAVGAARRLARAPDSERTAVMRAAADYSLALDVAGIDDAYVVGSQPVRGPSLAIRALILWITSPIVTTVLVVNAVPVALVVLVDHFVPVPVTKGTVRALVAVVAFPAAWITFAALTTDGWARIAGLTLAGAVALPVVVWLIEGTADDARRWWRQHRARVAVGRQPALSQRRDEVVRAFVAAVG